MIDLKEQLRAYFDEVDPPLDTAEVMRDARSVSAPRRRADPAQGALSRWRGPLVAVTTALAVVIAVAAAALLWRGGPGDVAGTPTTPPATATTITSTTVPSEETAEALTFADDDLCEWVAADRIAAFFSSAYESSVDDWDGTAEVQQSRDLEPDECWWRLATTTDDDYFSVHAWNANPGVVLLPAEIVEYEGGLVGYPGPTASGHPALSEGVVVQSAGWGIYTFWVPPSDNYLALSISRVTQTSSGTEVSQGLDSLATGQARIEKQVRFFSFADQLLRELGWVP
ncbi:MAG: hypothetical protein QNJ89_07995 [Acidimicrobiia bacterium]|nr:hypothetical protein [Acidimicrobiia bacterium]